MGSVHIALEPMVDPRAAITLGYRTRMASGLPQFTFPKFPQVPICRPPGRKE